MKLTIQYVAQDSVWDVEDHAIHVRSKRRHINFLFGVDVILHVERRVKEIEAKREEDIATRYGREKKKE